jgi:hypothetical protein
MLEMCSSRRAMTGGVSNSDRDTCDDKHDRQWPDRELPLHGYCVIRFSYKMY